MNSTILFLLLILTQCKQNDKENKIINTEDRTEILTSNIQRMNSPALDDWQRYEIGNETIFTPKNWKGQLINEELIVRPLDAVDTVERVSFVRYMKDSPNIDYDKFSSKITNLALANYQIIKKETSKFIFERFFCIETNTKLNLNSSTYTSSCLVYVDNKSVYQFIVIVSDSRIKSYDGDLIKDIVGNIKVNKDYIYNNNNKIRDIITIEE